MNFLSFLALILLSLLAYSGGVVGKTGRSSDVKPQLIDLFLVLVIWSGAVYPRLVLNFNKWLLILFWIILSATIGMLSAWPRKARPINHEPKPKENPSGFIKRIWQSWKSFSLRLGSFQSRIWLSLFFFVFISPAAILIKTFSDPLGIKEYSKISYWLPKKDFGSDPEQFKRQF